MCRLHECLPLTVPEVPTSLQDKSIGTSYIEVQWQRPPGGVDEYELQYKESSSTEDYISVEIGGQISNYNIPDLSAGKKYHIQIRSKSGDEYSPYTVANIGTGKEENSTYRYF